MHETTTVCVRCGTAIAEPTGRFCPKCGTRVLRPNESPLAVISFRWLLSMLILAQVAGIALVALFGNSAGNLFVVQVFLAAWAVFVVWRYRLSVAALLGRVPRGYNWGGALLLVPAMIVYAVGATAVVYYSVASLDNELAASLLFQPLEESVTAVFIAAVVVAPIVEEMTFRGLRFGTLAERWGKTAGMVVSSGLFAVLHLDPIGAFVFGMAACVLYVRTRTLLVPIAVHALNNLLVGLLSLGGLGDAQAPTDWAAFWTQYLYIGFIAMLVSSPIVFGLLGRWWPAKDTVLPYRANVHTGDDTGEVAL